MASLRNELDKLRRDIPIIYERTVVAEIRKQAQKANMPEEFIKNIRMVQEGGKLRVVNDWTGPKGEDFATWIDVGTHPHEILPKANNPDYYENPFQAHEVMHGPGVLHWKDADTGKDVFRTRVFHKGIKGPNSFARGGERGKQKFLKQFETRIRQMRKRLE